MLKHSLARGIIVAAAVGAAIAFATSCSPVSNSVSKLPNRNRTLGRDVETGGAARIISEEYVVPANEAKSKLASLPEGLKEVELSKKSQTDLEDKAATIVTLPGVHGAVQIYTILEVNLSAEAIEKRELNQIKVEWTRLSPKSNEFALVLIDNEKSNAKRDLVKSNLTGVTLSYRELE